MKRYILAATLIFSITLLKAQTPDSWVEYLTPSAIHSLFAKYTGSFKMEISMYSGDEKEPSMITVNSEHSMLLGGRYLEMKQQGKMMGMDYQSVMIVGLNNTDKKMALTTITNMGTGTLSLFGAWDEKTKSATLFGQLTNPVTKNTINVRQVLTFIDENTLLIESFDQEDVNPEIKTVQYKLIRKS